MIIGSYHKTGSLLFSNIWNYYFKKKCKNFNHFDRVSDNMIKNTKCVDVFSVKFRLNCERLYNQNLLRLGVLPKYFLHR